MQRLPLQELSRQPDSPEARSCGRYWRDLAIDSLLELATAREQLAGIDEDEVGVLAARSRDFYLRVLPDKLLADDPRKGVAFWRAFWRARLRGGQI